MVHVALATFALCVIFCTCEQWHVDVNNGMYVSCV